MAGHLAEPVLRHAVPADVDAVLAFWRRSAEGTDRTDDRASVLRLVEHDPQALLLAVEDGSVVGTVIAGWDGWRGSLYRIAVREDRRGHGIARELVAAAEARFTALGAQRADAMVLEGNALGRAAWAALGYAPQPQWRRWVKRLR